MPAVKRRELLRAEADDRHAVGLQILQRQAKIQDRLGPGADHRDRRIRQLLQIGRDVHRGFRPAMHAADAACSEEGDARHMGDHHGRRHRRGAIQAPGADGGDIPPAGLGDLAALLSEILNLLRGQTGLQPPADDGDGGRHGAAFPDDFLHIQSRFDILRIGHAVADDGAFQRHHRLPGCQGFRHFGLDIQIGIAHLNSLLA